MLKQRPCNYKNIYVSRYMTTGAEKFGINPRTDHLIIKENHQTTQNEICPLLCCEIWQILVTCQGALL